MRVLRLAAHFGVLDGGEVSFTPGQLQLIIDANERGKSTLIAAIVAALYGLASGSRAITSEAARYEPLSGSRFDIELDCEAEGRRLRIRRNFTRGSCTISDLDAVQEVTSEFQTGKNSWDAGQRLLGLNREQFLRSCLVRQQECSALHLEKDAVTLTARIQQLVDTGAGENTADAAIAALDSAMREYDGVTFKGTGNVSHEARALRAQVQMITGQMEELRRDRARLDEPAKRLAQLHKAVRCARAERDAAARLALAADGRAASNRLARDDEQRGRRDHLLAEREALGPMPALPPGLLEALATLDGSIAAHDRQLEQESIALASAEQRRLQSEERLAGLRQFGGASSEMLQEIGSISDRLRLAQQAELDTAARLRRAEVYANAGDAELGGRFGPLTPVEEEQFASYPDRRGELLAALAGVAASRAPASVANPWKLLLAGGVVVALLGLPLTFILSPVGVLLVLLGAGVAVWAFRRRPPEQSSATETGTRETERRLRELDSQAAAIAARLGYEDAFEAVSVLRRWQQVRPWREELRAALQEHEAAASHLATCREEAARVFAVWSWNVAASDLDAERLHALQQEIEIYLRGRDEFQESEAAEAKVRERRGHLQGQRDRLAASYSEASGAPAGTATERATTLQCVREQAQRLSTHTLITGQLEELGTGLLSDDERTLLARAVTTADAHDECGLVTGRTAGDYRDEMARLTRAAEASEQEAHQLQLRIGAALDNYEREYPRLEIELEQKCAALARAEGFASAAGLARMVLAEVARETHRDWARRLNQSSGGILSAFGGEHTELRFGEQLDFMLRDRGTGQEWSRADVERRLSAGARDQIYLAIRFALAAYFSPNPCDPLPLILDDPLTTSDDSRFAAVMAYLLEQSETRQVIVLTCHEQRHRLWLDTVPGAASRVQVLDLRPVESAVGVMRGLIAPYKEC